MTDPTRECCVKAAHEMALSYSCILPYAGLERSQKYMNPTIICLPGNYFAITKYMFIPSILAGARGSVVVKALCCKPEGRGFKSR
jgi:hypothetical protein